MFIFSLKTYEATLVPLRREVERLRAAGKGTKVEINRRVQEADGKIQNSTMVCQRVVKRLRLLAGTEPAGVPTNSQLDQLLVWCEEALTHVIASSWNHEPLPN